MHKTFRYRIYPSQAQQRKLNDTLAWCCELYNAALQERREAYQRCGKTVTYSQQQNQLPGLKVLCPELKQVHSQVLQDVLRRLDKAFAAFFRRLRAGEKPGYPRFRSRRRYDSLTYSQSGFGIRNGKLFLSKLGPVKIKLHRPLAGMIKTLTITRTTTGKWFACFAVAVEVESLPATNAACGVDVGLEKFATLSTGEEIANPRFFRQEEKQLAKAQKKLSAQPKGSPQYHQHRKVVARLHERIANRRREFAHQLSRWLVLGYGLIVFEKLNIRGMVKNHCLAKSIADAAWHQLVRYTLYKAAEAGRVCLQVDPRHTSQTCSGCGHREAKELRQRIHACAHCGLTIGRDLNAALNIVALGLQSIGSQPIEAPPFKGGE